MKITWRERLSREAGFFDGEGHVGASPRRGHITPKLAIGISQNDRRVLDRFRDSVGLGKVYGPYHKTEKLFYYQVDGFQRVQAIIAMLWAFLGPVKQEQAAAALAKIRSIPSYRHVCRRGHPRIRGERVCRPCNAAHQALFRVRHRERLRAAAYSEAHRTYHREYQRRTRWAKRVNDAAAALPWLEVA